MINSVDFYILQYGEHAAQHQFTCELVEKAYQEGHQLQVLTSSIDESKALDKCLWEFRKESFVPHHLSGDSYGSPIKITHFDQTTGSEASWLINLSSQIPKAPSLYERIIEIIANDDKMLSTARENYKHYKALGAKLNTHKITQQQAHEGR